MYRFTLIHNSNRLVIPEDQEPIGWEDTKFTLKRDENWHGFLVDYSVDLKFCCEAIDFIWNAWLVDSVNAEIKINIERYAGDSTCESVPNTWQLVYEGKINITSIVRDYGENVLAANIEPSGSVMRLLNGQETPIDLFTTIDTEGNGIAVPSTAPFNLFVQGRPLVYRSTWNESQDATYSTPQQVTGGRNILQFFGNLDYSDLAQSQPVPMNLVTSNTSPDWFMYNLWQPLLTTQVTGDYELCLSIDATVYLNHTAYVDDSVFSADFGIYEGEPWGIANTPIPPHLNSLGWQSLATHSAILTAGQQTNCGDIPATDSFNIIVNFNYTYTNVAAGLCFYLGILNSWSDYVFGGNQTCFTIKFNSNSFVSIKLVDTVDGTYHKSFYPDDAFNIVAQSISGLNIASDTFTRDESDCYAYTALTSGMSLRGFEQDTQITGTPDCWNQENTAAIVRKATCNTTLAKLFSNLDAVFCLGMGIEYSGGTPYLRIERREYFYDTTNVILTISELDKYNAKYSRSIAQDRLYKNIKIGYDKYLDDTSLNGADETNTYREYTTNAREVNGSMDIVCEYISSEYLAEQTRRAGAATDNTQYDEDIFIFALSTDDAVTLAYECDSLTSENVLLPAEKFNARLTPYYMARRHAAYLDSIINYRAGAGNVLAKFEVSGFGLCEIANDYHRENDDITTVLIAPYLGKEIVEFNYPISWGEYNAIKANPYGLIFLSDDNEYWFIREIQFIPNKESKFTLIKKK